MTSRSFSEVMMYTAAQMLAVLHANTPFKREEDFKLAKKLLTNIRRVSLQKNAVKKPEQIFAAILDSSKIHEGIYRANDVTPYILHLLEVVWILLTVRIYDRETLVAAALHDTHEDTEDPARKIAIEKMIKKKYGERVWNIVYLLSKKEEEKNLKDAVWKRMLSEPDCNILWRVLVIKYADRIHNARTFNDLKDQDKVRKKIKETLYWFPIVKEHLKNSLRHLWERRTLKNKSKLSLHIRLDHLLQEALHPYLHLAQT
jgi:(p)ppGpp synthase/HD superfamily hydrolase